MLAAIRGGQGAASAFADVMRLPQRGCPWEQADPLMARLMLDYEGDVGVSDDGGIFYAFPAMRKTASEAEPSRRSSSPPSTPAAWDSLPKPLPPLTGNSVGANFAIAALNGFNFLMGFWAIGNGLTIERVSHLFDRVPPPVVDTGLPIALGVVPLLLFSALLFLVPVGRALVRPLRQRQQTEERGRLAVLRAVLERVRGKQPVTDGVVAEAWRSAAGRPAEPKRLDRALVALGGDVDIEGDDGAETPMALPGPRDRGGRGRRREGCGGRGRGAPRRRGVRDRRAALTRRGARRAMGPWNPACRGSVIERRRAGNPSPFALLYRSAMTLRKLIPLTALLLP